jgi:hypothetical protein
LSHDLVSNSARLPAGRGMPNFGVADHSLAIERGMPDKKLCAMASSRQGLSRQS